IEETLAAALFSNEEVLRYKRVGMFKKARRTLFGQNCRDLWDIDVSTFDPETQLITKITIPVQLEFNILEDGKIELTDDTSALTKTAVNAANNVRWKAEEKKKIQAGTDFHLDAGKQWVKDM